MLTTGLLCTINLVLFTICGAASTYHKPRNALLPSFVKLCHRSDPQLSACVRDAVQSLKSHIPLGIPELFLPPIEPLVVPEVMMSQDTGAIYMRSTYEQIHIHGLSNYTLTQLQLDMQRPRLTLSMSFPNVTMEAQYKIDGKIMMMPLLGGGACRANFTDVELDIILLAERYKRHGNVHLRVTEIKTKYTLGRSALHLDNLFNGDNALGDRMNFFINENWSSLSEEVRPLLENALSEIVRSTADKLFETYSLDDLLPE